MRDRDQVLHRVENWEELLTTIASADGMDGEDTKADEDENPEEREG